MDEEFPDFIFEESISKIDYSPAIQSLEKKLKNPLNFNKKIIEEKISSYKKEQENLDISYANISWFFSEMERQKKCKASLCFNTVFIEGKGLETAIIREKPRYYMSEDKNSKSTVIPVTIGNDECNLLLFCQPQTEIPRRGTLFIDYEFKTEFKLFETYRITDDIDKKWKFADINNNLEYLFYGNKNKNKFCLRVGDGLWEEIHNSMFDKFDNSPMPRREKYALSGQMFTRDQLYYQGNFECDGTFPFFVRRDDRGDRQKAETPDFPSKILTRV